MTLSAIFNFFLTPSLTMLGAFFGTYFAFAKFKKERLWDEKHNAYTEILLALHQIKKCADHKELKELQFPTMTKEEDGSIEKYQGAFQTLIKHKETGALILNEQVIDTLEKVTDEIYQERHSYSENNTPPEFSVDFELANHFRAISEIVKESLPRITQLAKDELQDTPLSKAYFLIKKSWVSLRASATHFLKSLPPTKIPKE